MNKIPLIAIVGRPNVGKSTFFNRLIGRRLAVTSKIPGVTRDRVSCEADLGGFKALFIDTAGLQSEKKSDLEKNIQAQVGTAIADADIIYFVIDAAEELTSSDFEAADLLRKAKKPVLLVANKSDCKCIEKYRYNLYELGFGDPIAVSSIHGRGIDEIEANTIGVLKKLKFKPYPKRKQEDIVNLAIVGRVNTGKSSLVNAVLGEERMIISEIPGTTIDTIDTLVTYQNQKFNLIDTAGIKRRGRIKAGIEKWSALRSLESISRSDICVLLLDVLEGVTNQDCHISEYALENYKGLILCANKCDLLEDPEKQKLRFMQSARAKMSYLAWAPLVFISALKKQNIFKIFDITAGIITERKKKIEDSVFRVFIENIINKHAPSTKVRIFGGKQTDVDPPEFTIYVDDPRALHFSYRRYIENELRKKFGFNGTAVKLIITSR